MVMDWNLRNGPTNTLPKEPSVLMFLDREIEESFDIRLSCDEIPEVPNAAFPPTSG